MKTSLPAPTTIILPHVKGGGGFCCCCAGLQLSLLKFSFDDDDDLGLIRTRVNNNSNRTAYIGRVVAAADLALDSAPFRPDDCLC